MAQSFTDIVTRLITNLKNAMPGIDTRVGTVLRDSFLTPEATEFLDAYNTIDVVSANQGVNTASQQSDGSLENLAANYGISRYTGSYASGAVSFYRFNAPTETIAIPAGTIVYTDMTAGRVTFRTLSTVNLTATSDFDPALGAYYVDAVVTCEIVGALGNVTAGGIVFTSVAGIDGVTNKNDTSGGKDLQTNDELVALIQSTAQGNLGTRTGYESMVRDNFAVDDVKIITPDDIDYARTRTVGAVDVTVLSGNRTPISESFPFVSPAVTNYIVPTYLPLFSVSQITGTGVSGAITLVEGEDYDVVYDTYSDYRRSVEEKSRINIHGTTGPTGTNLINNSMLDVSYNTSALVTNIQAFLEREENKVIGADLLVKMGIEIPTLVEATVKIIPGYTTTVVQSDIETTLAAYFNALLLDDDVQASDVITVIGNVAGVDSVNVETFKFALVSAPTVPVEEVTAGKQEYIRLNLDESNIQVGI